MCISGGSRYPPRQLECLEEVDGRTRFVAVEIGDGNAELGMKLEGAARKLRDDIGGGPPRDKTVLIDPVEAARASIGDQATDTALAAGRALSSDEAIELAATGELVKDPS